MENTTKAIRQVNCTCEHIWHRHLWGNVINAETLLKQVNNKLQLGNNSNTKIYVDNWIAQFSTRTGLWKVFTKTERETIGAGGRRNAENKAFISYLQR